MTGSGCEHSEGIQVQVFHWHLKILVFLNPMAEIMVSQ
jgi:hypothetical protein